MKRPNPLSQLTKQQKTDKYWIDVNNPQVRAYFASGDSERLGKIQLESVEFIGGLWRVQQELAKEIVTIRDKEFTLYGKLDINEKNQFKYQRAKEVYYNCYGPQEAGQYMVIANYHQYWAYGDSVEKARAFLGIKLFDIYNNLIHEAVAKEKIGNEKK